jgi:hypothetical protein
MPRRVDQRELSALDTFTDKGDRGVLEGLILLIEERSVSQTP